MVKIGAIGVNESLFFPRKLVYVRVHFQILSPFWAVGPSQNPVSPGINVPCAEDVGTIYRIDITNARPKKLIVEIGLFADKDINKQVNTHR